jgi:isochorismate hydrolase
MSAYYTKKNLDKKAAAYLKEVESLTRPWTVDSKRAALLVIDMQRYFLNKESHAYIPSAEPIVPRIKSLQEAFLNTKRPVYMTRHVNDDLNAGTMVGWWADLIEEGPMAEIVEPLHDDRIKIVQKGQYDAFLNTDLELCLKNQKVEQVVITGVTTHLCCESTARSAFMRGFEVFFVVDGVATFREAFHRAAILNLSHGFAVPVLAGDILNGMAEKS